MCRTPSYGSGEVAYGPSTSTDAAAPVAKITGDTARSASPYGRMPRTGNRGREGGQSGYRRRSSRCWRSTGPRRKTPGRRPGSSGQPLGRTTGGSSPTQWGGRSTRDSTTTSGSGWSGTSRNGRLHDARRTAATVLLLLGISDTAVDKVMGWEPGGAMRRRYQHATDPVLQSIASKIGSTCGAPRRMNRGRTTTAPQEPWYRPSGTRTETHGRGAAPRKFLGAAPHQLRAVAVGFEPTEELPPHTLSRRAP